MKISVYLSIQRYGRSHMPCPSCSASLILQRPGCKLRLLLLKWSCKEPHIFIYRSDPLHFLSCQFKVKDIKIIPNMLRITAWKSPRFPHGGCRSHEPPLLHCAHSGKHGRYQYGGSPCSGHQGRFSSSPPPAGTMYTPMPN